MKKPKEDHNFDCQVECCQSILATGIRICVDCYGLKATKKALEWFVTILDENPGRILNSLEKAKHEDEDEST